MLQLLSSFVLYIAFKAREYLPVSLNETLGAPDSSIIFTLASSVAVIIVALVAIIATSRKSSQTLYLVSLFMTIISVSKLISGFFIYRLQADIVHVTMIALKMAIEYYATIGNKFVDETQTMFKCCGVYDLTVDWEKYVSTHNKSYPLSCCNFNNSTLITSNSFCFNPVKEPCIPIVSAVLGSLLKQISLFSILNSICQMLVVFVSLSLAKMFTAMKLTRS